MADPAFAPWQQQARRNSNVGDARPLGALGGHDPSKFARMKLHNRPANGRWAAASTHAAGDGGQLQNNAKS